MKIYFKAHSLLLCGLTGFLLFSSVRPLLSAENKKSESTPSSASLEPGCRKCSTPGKGPGLCPSFGLEQGEVYCDLFSKDEIQKGMYKDRMKIGLFGPLGLIFADTDKIDFRDMSAFAIKYIGTSSDRKRLLVGTDKSVGLASRYALAHGIGNTFEIKEGLPMNKKNKMFGLSTENTKGLYTLLINTNEYPLIFTERKLIIVFDKDEDIICAGKFSKQKTRLFCANEFAKAFMKIMPRSKGDFCKVELVNLNYSSLKKNSSKTNDL